MSVSMKVNRTIFMLAASVAVASSDRVQATAGIALIQARVQGNVNGTEQRWDKVSLMDQTSADSFPVPQIPMDMMGPQGVGYWRNRGWTQGAMACVVTGTEVKHYLRGQGPPCRNPIKKKFDGNFARYVRTIEAWEFPGGGAAWRNQAFQIGYKAAKDACYKIVEKLPRHSTRCIERFFCNAYRQTEKNEDDRKSYKERFPKQYKASFIKRHAKHSVCSSKKKHCDC